MVVKAVETDLYQYKEKVVSRLESIVGDLFKRIVAAQVIQSLLVVERPIFLFEPVYVRLRYGAVSLAGNRIMAYIFYVFAPPQPNSNPYTPFT